MRDANGQSRTSKAREAVYDLPAGHVLSKRYRIVRKIDSGGMGTVYLVEHVSIQKPFAAKVLSPRLARQGDTAARFLQEARVASRIGHDNVVDISDFGETEDGLVFFVMEYLEGTDIDAAVRAGGPLPWARVRPIMLQIVSALGAAHDKGIIHRDVKPANVFLCSRRGRSDFVKILDFGIAKVLDSTDDNEVITNRELEVLGTPSYMAPEQSRGEEVDGRTDIYACGCLLYYLLTGSPPFRAGTQFGILMKQVMEAPPPPSTKLPPGTLSPQVDDLVLKALAKHPNDRWQTMNELAAAIAAAPALANAPSTRAQAAIESNAPTATLGRVRAVDSAPSPRTRWRRLALICAAGALAIAAGALWLRARVPPADRPLEPLPRSSAVSPPPIIETAPAPEPTTPPPLPPPSVEEPSRASAPARPERNARPRPRRSREPVFEPLAEP
jgi:serine/threonine-protein kinase